MMQNLSILLMAAIFFPLNTALAFQLGATLVCGPMKFDIIDNYPPSSYSDDQYFYISFDKLEGKEKFIIFNDGHQYPSFKKQYYDAIYKQNGGVFYSTLEENKDNLVFAFITENYSGPSASNSSRIGKIKIDKETKFCIISDPGFNTEVTGIKTIQGICSFLSGNELF